MGADRAADPRLVVGSGPTEAHALIDVDCKARTVIGASTAQVTVLATTVADGQWSMLARVGSGDPAR